MKYLCTLFLCLMVMNRGLAQKDSLSVYYETGESSLPAVYASLLDSLYDSNYIKSSSVLYIIGYADEPGTKESNKQIAQQRATAVKEFLSTLGVKQIAACKSAGNIVTTGNDPQQRRVDIIIGRSPGTVKTAKKTGSVREQQSRLASIANMDVNSTLVLYGLNFVTASTKLLPQAYPVMDELLKVLNEHPALKISVEGHVCCGIDPATSGVSHNQLSFARAKAVYNYLKSHGVDTARLSYEGFGFSRPKIFPECNEQDRVANRRVEVRVLSK